MSVIPQPKYLTGWPHDQGEDAYLLTLAEFAFPPDTLRHFGVAVSGGGDSVALLHLMARTCQREGTPLQAVTVDHRLRAESAFEAASVAALCSLLGVPHTILVWEHGPIKGNVMDKARRARMDLIANWAGSRGVTHVALGHTADDRAESFLMALSRASGLDGLVGMRGGWHENGLTWGRPLLHARREELRAYLRRNGIGWAEDPTNEDPRYERTRARQVLAALVPLGIDAEKIGQTAGHLREAKQALTAILRKSADEIVVETAGALRVDRAGFRALPPELQRRMLVAALAWLSGDPMPPRSDEQDDLRRAAHAGWAATLHGCQLRIKKDHLIMTREARDVIDLKCPSMDAWDTRWQLDGPHAPGLTIRALGPRGLPQIKKWRALGIPREALLVTPAVWDGETLLAAPVAGMENGWKARIATPFHTFLVSD